MQSSSPLLAGSTIGVTGASGLVGSALLLRLAAAGHTARCLPRPANAEELSWVLRRTAPLQGVVHLAGEPIAGRWTAAKKSRIRQSRVEGTRALCEALAAAERPPHVLVCASAIGFYGSRGDELLDETSPAGQGFLADVVQAWEASAQPAVDRGIRVVFLRFGMILSARGGALAKMLPAFRFGLGGRIGDGRQYWSWISLDDAVGAIVHALATEGLFGPVNAVAPQPVTNAEFTRALGAALHRPAFFRVPAWAARATFGEMADELLLAGARVAPRRLLESGYAFRHAELSAALRDSLGDVPQTGAA